MNRILSIFATVVLSCLTFAPVFAQGGYEVKGVVVDELGPIMGVTVMEKGTQTGTSTGLDGDFSLKVSKSSAVIEISCIGYRTLTFVASEMPEQITMSEDELFLDEVVVIGYGSISKKELSSSIVQVDKEKFFKGSMNNPMEMLNGKVAGLNVNTTAAANPNSSSSLQVRGATSLSASNSPLIVIDGVPGGDIRNLAPQDIESMTVLKDAASAAIYGTRGANGVILVTTKKGNANATPEAHMTYDSWFGVNFEKDRPQMLTADEFRRSLRGNDYGYNTDWYSLIMRDFSYDHNQYLGIDGGTVNGNYSASINYKKATGMDIRSSREEFGARTAVEHRAFDNILTLNLSLNARRVNEEWGNDGMFDTALTLNPTMPVYNEDGSWYQPTTATGIKNPYQELMVNANNGQRSYLLGTIEAKVKLFTNENHNLSTTVNYSLHYNDLKSNYYTPSTSGESFWNGYDGRASVSYNKYWTNHSEWLFNYMYSIPKHTLTAVAGYTYEDTNWEQIGGSNNNFAYDNLLYHDLSAGTYLKDGKASLYSGKSLSKLIGLLGRVNYNYNDIVMASASVRYEGSTKFGANHKWGWFPAASVAVELANMPFMQELGEAVTSLKPRVSYGVTGRSDFDAYKSLATYSTKGSYFIDGKWVTGYAPSLNANDNLGWEKLVSTNIGVDFGFLGSRIRGSVDLFNRQSQDLLYNYTAPQPPYIYNSILVNVGTTTNNGVELALEGDIVKKKDFVWTSGINYSYGKTVLTKLSSDVYTAAYVEMYQKSGVGTTEYFFRTEEGSEVGQIYGYEMAGVDENGNLLVYNKDQQPIAASAAQPDDKRYIGSTTPKHFLSWSNTLRYKNWDLNLFFNGAFGFQIFNMPKYNMGLQGCGSDNVLRTAYTKDSNVFSGAGIISSYFLERGDFFKLDNLTLGYNFNLKDCKHMQSLRLYLSAKNIYTLTGYTGNDPSTISLNGLTPGIDSSSTYPLATTVTFGVTARF